VEGVFGGLPVRREEGGRLFGDEELARSKGKAKTSWRRKQ
jgi:hypothetical protein